MTGRTHDLIGFTALLGSVIYLPLSSVTLATAVSAIGANWLGSIAPDIDDSTSDFWHHLPAGSLLGKIIHPLLGGHRMISHSLFGIFLFGWFTSRLLAYIGRVVLVDMTVVWFSFMLGYICHLLADTLTKDGVPWFFPLPFRLGFPPFKFLRLATGGFAEKAVIFPAFMILNGYFIYTNYPKLLDFLSHYIKY